MDAVIDLTLYGILWPESSIYIDWITKNVYHLEDPTPQTSLCHIIRLIYK